MRCPNCGHDNPKKNQLCEECGANFSKTAQADGGTEASSFIITILRFIFKFLLFVLLLAIVLGGIWAFTCVFELPAAPEDGLPDFVIQGWQKVENIQHSQCANKQYWFGPNAGNIEEILGEPSPETEHDEEISAEVPQASEMCGHPSIHLEPASGPIGTTFEITLEGFSENDSIDACWYYPDGELINCAELVANIEGFRTTTFWSEPGDPAGKYRMETKGRCSEVEITWIVSEAVPE